MSLVSLLLMVSCGLFLIDQSVGNLLIEEGKEPEEIAKAKEAFAKEFKPIETADAEDCYIGLKEFMTTGKATSKPFTLACMYKVFEDLNRVMPTLIKDAKKPIEEMTEKLDLIISQAPIRKVKTETLKSDFLRELTLEEGKFAELVSKLKMVEMGSKTAATSDVVDPHMKMGGEEEQVEERQGKSSRSGRGGKGSSRRSHRSSPSLSKMKRQLSRLRKTKKGNSPAAKKLKRAIAKASKRRSRH